MNAHKKQNPKRRLDVALQEAYPHLSRNQIQSFIMQGLVSVDDKIETKAGTMLGADKVPVLAHDEVKYVSRAGFKLEGALQQFGIDVTGLVVLDAGISTGGFTDCLLQHGAARVYGVDVGENQVHGRVANDARVTLLENTNLRYLKTLPEPVDLATLDLSFISLLKVMDAVSALLKPEAQIIALIKPQFEAQRHQIGRKGLVSEPKVHQEVVEKITQGMTAYGFVRQALIESPIRGAASGNVEFLAWFKRASSS